MQGKQTQETEVFIPQVLHSTGAKTVEAQDPAAFLGAEHDRIFDRADADAFIGRIVDVYKGIYKYGVGEDEEAGKCAFFEIEEGAYLMVGAARRVLKDLIEHDLRTAMEIRQALSGMFMAGGLDWKEKTLTSLKKRYSSKRLSASLVPEALRIIAEIEKDAK